MYLNFKGHISSHESILVIFRVRPSVRNFCLLVPNCFGILYSIDATAGTKMTRSHLRIVLHDPTGLCMIVVVFLRSSTKFLRDSHDCEDLNETEANGIEP